MEKYEQKMNNDYSLAKLALGDSPNQLKKILKKKRKRTRLTWAKDVNMVKWRMETSYEENFSDNTVGDRDFLRYFVVSLSSFFSDQV